ncbi:MAG: hypothetical protein EA428_07170 [Spirochaetaceae bacterium]|nr:MAG: hypothetical protein EA428_07170 [Spirochaetaceae bacterium]
MLSAGYIYTKHSFCLHLFMPNWSRVFLDAERIGETLSRRLGTRSLDILHIAVARDSPADVFLTNDARQGHAAEHYGLQVEFLSGLD